MHSFVKFNVWKDKNKKTWFAQSNSIKVLLSKDYWFFGRLARKRLINEIIVLVATARTMSNSEKFKIKKKRKKTGYTIEIAQFCRNTSYFTRIDINFIKRTT